MDNLYIGSLVLFSSTFIPKNLLPCDGRFISVSTYSALYTVLQGIYGYNSKDNTFALPDLRGRIPVGFGEAPGMLSYPIGNTGGYETVLLNSLQMANHIHIAEFVPVSSGSGSASVTVNAGNGTTSNSSKGKYWGKPGNISLNQVNLYSTVKSVQMNPNAVSVNVDGGIPYGNVTVYSSGNSQPHENRSPVLALMWGIVYDGDYPPFQ